jgi:hypothetical protein
MTRGRSRPQREILVDTSALLQSRLGRGAARAFLLDLVPYLDVA